MKVLSSKLALILTFALFIQTIPQSASANSALNSIEKAEKVNKYIDTYQTIVHAKIVTNEVAINNLVSNFQEIGASVDDIDLALQLRVADSKMPVEEYISFQDTIVSSNELAQHSENNKLDAKEYGVLVAQATNVFDRNGVAWNACTTKGVGWGLVAVGVIAGVVALVLSRGIASIKKKYANKRRNREQQYLNDISWIEDRPEQLQRQMNDLEGEIQVAINRQTAITHEALHDTNLTQAERDELLAEYDKLTDFITIARRDLETMADERADYEDDNFTAIKYAQLDDDFEFAMEQLDIEEQRKIENVPRNQENAGKVAIGAGASAAIGIILIAASTGACKKLK